MTDTAPALRGRSHDELATLVPELLLTGQMIDRSGMAHLISAFGRETMGRIAIEEWMAASPVYTHRVRTALGIDGDGVEDMFKCIQLDIGAPPQFMDFRFEVTDAYHGAFVLDHCGALMDVEPLGDEYVTTMCHDIEDPTFDATAIATNRRARIRPIHRPPRLPADRTPHCAWSVTVEPDREELPLPPDAEQMFGTRAAAVELSPIDTTATDGWVDYRRPLVADVQFREWSQTTLVRILEEVSLQHQLLALGFLWSLQRVASGPEQVAEIVGKQLTGIAGLAAERIATALRLGVDAQSLATIIGLHPCFGPAQYTGVQAKADGDDVVVLIPADSPAMADGGWMSFLDPEHLDPVQALATAVDDRWVIDEATAGPHGLEIRLRVGQESLPESGEVAIARFSSGAAFEFVDRGRSIPITPVGSGV